MLPLFAASSPSSRGLGHQPFTLVTRVRIPLGTPILVDFPMLPRATFPASDKLCVASMLAAMLALAACQEKATLDRSRVEMVTLEGRKFEVRVAPTGVADEYRMVVVRGSMVINPNPKFEHQRTWKVARQVMDRTCKDRPYQTFDENLIDDVNLQLLFRCQA
jgi:hypothetical protein